MSKIEDALKKIEAAREQAPSAEGEQAPPPASVVIGSPAQANIDQRIVAYHEPLESPAAAFSQIHVDIRNNNPEISTIGFTSAWKGEGKSVVALNVAIALARDCEEATVCIVDADLHKPSQHSLLGLQNTVGLSDALTGTMPASSLTIPTPVNRLFLLPAGSKAPNPKSLFSSARVEDVIAELQSRYTFTIYDCPPVLLCPETKDLAVHLQGVVLVVRANKTNRKLVDKARAKLQPETEQGGVDIIGFVLNKAESEWKIGRKHKR
ncbi:MAG TPA: CpsD/CapB family tyrosine-protein kinase [Planctomycetota bacterium]|nr:CpsD/CapB family tyrosine-protein kinase [Planctomycetota bacterium]HUW35182.1 CpsD/CapB family tyrosine-protein kinase [Planctomycetota bacterium]